MPSTRLAFFRSLESGPGTPPAGSPKWNCVNRDVLTYASLLASPTTACWRGGRLPVMADRFGLRRATGSFSSEREAHLLPALAGDAQPGCSEVSGRLDQGQRSRVVQNVAALRQ